MNIENLKKILESEKRKLIKTKYKKPSVHNTTIYTANALTKSERRAFNTGHEAATNRLLPLLEKAIEMAEFYNGLYVFSESDDDSEQLHIDKPWRYSSGKRAREFLSEFTKMAEINKDELK